MEHHPECSMCVHNTVIHNLNETQKDVNFNSWNKEHVLTQKEVFMDWKVHTSAYFVRKEDAYRPLEFRKYWFGDYVRLTLAYTEGNVVSLPYIMSQYNYGVSTGALHAVDYGNVCSTEEIERIAHKYELKVIYDAAHTFGETYKGKGIVCKS